MREKQEIKKFYEGTAIRITVIISVATATSALITIDDPSEIEKVTNATMTKDADKVYSYIWQSTKDTDDDGDYIVTIKITYGGYTSVTQDKFSLIEQE